jgi:hypothetical protein
MSERYAEMKMSDASIDRSARVFFSAEEHHEAFE